MESTLKRTWAEINIDNLIYNYKTIRSHTDDNVKFLGVVKADAYGHGALQISRALQEEGADYLAVSSVDEAMELRNNGINMPILILGHTPAEQIPVIIKNDITQAVTCEAKAIEYNREAKNIGKKLKVHIKIDTGMSRLGFLLKDEHFDNGTDAIIRSCNMEYLDAEGVFTHFAVSDEFGEEKDKYTEEQFKLFIKTIETVEKSGFKFKIRHCANTGATVRFKEKHLDMIRPGLLLYGYGEFAKEWGLKPVMDVKSVVNTIKIYDENTYVSYGGIFKTKRKTRMGVLPIGYADGLFRSLSNRYNVYAKGKKLPICGKICMDMCMVDLTDAKDVCVGDEIEIFGKNNPIEDMALIIGTIPYELTCAISKRVLRIYYKDGKEICRELRLLG